MLALGSLEVDVSGIAVVFRRRHGEQKEREQAGIRRTMVVRVTAQP